MNIIKNHIHSGKKLEAIKEFITQIDCSLLKAKEAIKEMKSSKNYDFEYYEKKYGKPAEEGDDNKKEMRRLAMEHALEDLKKTRRKNLRILLLSTFLTLVLGAGVMVFFNTDFFMPQSQFYTIAVELDNGELFETTFLGSVGAINRKGEFLMEYNASKLAEHVGLYLGNEPWSISKSDNPYFKGKIQGGVPGTEGSSWFSSKTVYGSINSSHIEDTFYNLSKEVVWIYNSNSQEGDLFQRVMKRTKVPGGESPVDYVKYINVNKFLAQNYGISVDMRYDKENQLIVFKVPKSVGK